MKYSTFHYLKPISIATSIALISACSSGGNSGGESLVQITHENAGEISGHSYNGSITSASAGQENTSSRSLTIPVNLNSDSRSTSTRTIQTKACSGGGSITILSTEDLDGDNELDAFKVQAHSCKIGSTLIDGDLSYKFTETYEGEIFELDSKHLSITDQNEKFVADNMHVRITESNTGFSDDYDMELTSSEGKVIIETDPIFIGTSPSSNYPDTGKMTVRGANGSFILLNADTGANNTVQVTVNDGTTSRSNTVDWEELSSDEFSL
jgi:hypothetical protein